MAAIHPVRHCTLPCHPGSAAFYEGAREAGEIREGKFNAGYILSDKNCEQTVGWTKSAFADDLLILRILLFAIDVFFGFSPFPQNVIRILSRLVPAWLGNSCPGL